LKFLTKWIPGFVLGLVAGSITAFAHADRIKLFDQPVYFGLVLAPVFLLVTQRGIMSYSKNRISGIAFAFGWLLITLKMGSQNADGDIALGGNWFTSAYVGLAALVLSMSSVISPRSKRLTSQ
jgi:hypothetical protein